MSHPASFPTTSDQNTTIAITAAVTAAVSAAVTAAGILYGPSLYQRVFKSERRARYVSYPEFREEAVLHFVYENATRDDPASVLRTIDDFCRRHEWMMNVGDDKGKVVEAEVKKKKPQVAVELGGYCGYSAVLIGALLPKGGHLYSIEIDALHAAIATKILEFAGLSSAVTVLVGTAATQVSVLKSRFHADHIDFLFIDHVKTKYLSDFLLLEAANVFVPGSVVVADNVIVPGAPDYLAHIRADRNWSSVFHESNLEYRPDIRDGLEVSTRV